MAKPPRERRKTGDAVHVGSAKIEIASEAIVIIDIVQATATSDLFGWYAVGRTLIRQLRQLVEEIGTSRGLSCIKSTGDGFLLTYRDNKSAELAAIDALQASFQLLRRLEDWNARAPEERQIAIRVAVHFGEVDIQPNDREGPNVAYTFRVEAVSRESLPQALDAIDPEQFPLRNYVICSERVYDIVSRRKPDWTTRSCGLFRLKGFSGWWGLFLVSAPDLYNPAPSSTRIDN